MQVDGVPQYLKGSVNFIIKGSEDSTEAIPRDCYADTCENILFRDNILRGEVTFSD